MTNFHVGQMVVCVTDFSEYCYDGITLPEKGRIYQVRAVLPSVRRDAVVALHLEEIVNPVRDYFEGRGEIQFSDYHFRPVRTTSIDIFTALLAPTPKVTADAPATGAA